MREIQASAAKTHLLNLLDAVEQGETVIITRHGRRIARLVPDVTVRRQEIEDAVAALRRLGRENGRMSVQDLLSARDEGRRNG